MSTDRGSLRRVAEQSAELLRQVTEPNHDDEPGSGQAWVCQRCGRWVPATRFIPGRQLLCRACLKTTRPKGDR